MNTTTLALAGLAAALAPVSAMAQDYDDPARSSAIENKSGVRVEGRVMWERLNDPEEDIGINYELGSGVAFGGEVGFDFPIGENIVLGPYANYEASSVESCDGAFCVSSGGYWAAGLQLGLVTGAQGMVYGKIGYGEQTIDVLGPIDLGGGEIVNIDESEKGGGYNAAIGYDHSFSENFYGRVELGISESYDIYGFDFQRVNAGVALGARF